MFNYFGPSPTGTVASCYQWYLDSILLWPYWFGCQCLSSTVRAATPYAVCMAHSFLTRPWFHLLWMSHRTAAFIFSSTRSLKDYDTTEEHNIPTSGFGSYSRTGALRHLSPSTPPEQWCVCVQQHVQACVFFLLWAFPFVVQHWPEV